MSDRANKKATGTHPDSADLTTRIKVLAHGEAANEVIDSANAEHYKVLLVCQDKSSQKWGPRWMMHYGLHATMLTEPSQALETARSLMPDAVLVESQLKDGNGERLYNVLNDAADIAAPVYVLCTAARDLAAALDVDIFDVARKPVDWQLLGRRVRETIRNRRRLIELESVRESLKEAVGIANDAREQLRTSESIEPLTG